MISVSPMATQTLFELPLLQYLKRENPVVYYHSSSAGSNTKTTKSNRKIPRYIRPWEDFEYESLKSIYGGALWSILDRPCRLPDYSVMPQFPFREIHDENSLESLLIKWTHSTVSDALDDAQKNHQAFGDREKVYMVRGGQAEIPGAASKSRPDWAGVWRSHTTKKGKPVNILPGDTKISMKWKSASIEKGSVDTAYELKDWLEPLVQIFTYCCKAEVRYGYIITDAELVVVRVKPGPQDDSQSAADAQTSLESLDMETGRAIKLAKLSGILEYKAIPWRSPGEGRSTSDDGQATSTAEILTINLALWWLHLMAADANDIKLQYPPLSETAWSSEAQPLPNTSFYSDRSALAHSLAGAELATTGEGRRPRRSLQRTSEKRSKRASTTKSKAPGRSDKHSNRAIGKRKRKSISPQ